MDCNYRPGIWLGHASPRLTACTNTHQGVTELKLTSGQRDTPPAAQFPQPVQAGWTGLPPVCSIPLCCLSPTGLLHAGSLSPGFLFSPVLLRCFPGQAWEGQVLPASQEGTGCSRHPEAVPGERSGERDPTGTAAGGDRGQGAVWSTFSNATGDIHHTQDVAL